MEVSLPGNTAAHRNAKCGGSGSSPEQVHRKTNAAFPVKDLQACLISLLKDQDESNLVEGGGDEESKEDSSDDNKIPEKYLSKSETFPPSHSLESSSSGNVARVQEKDPGICEAKNRFEESDKSFSRSLSLPASSKLIPAIKGSHQKHGTMPPRKLSVTWAPDVYDPIPTSVSHVPSSKQQHHKYNNRRKKSDKYHYKQKDGGKSSRSSSSKSKKSKDNNKTKSGSSSSNSIKPLNDDTGAVQGVLPAATATSTELVF